MSISLIFKYLISIVMPDYMNHKCLLHIRNASFDIIPPVLVRLLLLMLGAMRRLLGRAASNKGCLCGPAPGAGVLDTDGQGHEDYQKT